MNSPCSLSPRETVPQSFPLARLHRNVMSVHERERERDHGKIGKREREREREGEKIRKPHKRAKERRNETTEAFQNILREKAGERYRGKVSLLLSIFWPHGQQKRNLNTVRRKIRPGTKYFLMKQTRERRTETEMILLEGKSQLVFL